MLPTAKDSEKNWNFFMNEIQINVALIASLLKLLMLHLLALITLRIRIIMFMVLI